MKNWVISENKEVVYKVGEFFIQVTTVEYILEQIYNEFVTQQDEKEKFSEMMLGQKIKELSQKIKLGTIQGEVKSISDWENSKNAINLITRLFLLKEFRNKIAHNALEYNSVDKQIYIRNELIENNLDEHILHVTELLGDLDIVLISLKEPKMKNYKKVITM